MNDRTPPNQNGDSPTRHQKNSNQNPVSQQLLPFASEAHLNRSDVSQQMQDQGDVPRLGKLILDYVRSRGQFGAIRDEMAVALERPIQSVCSTVWNLINTGLLVPTKERRRTRWGRKASVVVAREKEQ